MATKNKKDKAPKGWQTIHLQLRQELVGRIDMRAGVENRTRVNMIATVLDRVFAAKEGVSA